MAGLETDKTNEFLQQLAKSVIAKKDFTSAVEDVLSGKKPTKSATKKSNVTQNNVKKAAPSNTAKNAKARAPAKTSVASDQKATTKKVASEKMQARRSPKSKPNATSENQEKKESSNSEAINMQTKVVNETVSSPKSPRKTEIKNEKVDEVSADNKEVMVNGVKGSPEHEKTAKEEIKTLERPVSKRPISNRVRIDTCEYKS